MSTPNQRKALRKYRKQLKADFADALTAMTEPGHQKYWFVPYLHGVLATYTKLSSKTVDGARLSSVLSRSSKSAIQKLIGKSCNRDRKTKSRWAAAIHAAFKANIQPEDLSEWLQKGGGVSGRARKSNGGITQNNQRRARR